MFLDPHNLAAAIAEEACENISQKALRKLAWALGNGGGLAPARTALYAVLADPLSASAVFTIVKTPLSVSRNARRLRDASRVISAFRQACGGSDRIGKQPTGGLWLPEIATPSNTTEVGGDLPPHQALTHQGRVINWYPLNQIRVGNVFYLYNYCTGALSVYQRVNAAEFAHILIQKPVQLVDVAEVAAKLAGSEPVSGIARIPGAPTILWA